MYHYVYKTICEYEGKTKYYIGKHSSKTLDNNYLGSGRKLKDLIRSKKPKTTKIILKTFDTAQKAYDYEAHLVNDELLKDPNCLNLKLGGNIAFSYSDESRDKMSKSRKGRFTGPDNSRYQVAMSDETKRKLSKSLTGKPGPNLGKVWSPASKHKLSESRKLCTGENASRKTKISVDGKIYPTIKQACESLSICRSVMYKRLKSNYYPNYVRL